MSGVMRGFAEHVVPGGAGYLMLVGPMMSEVADDPEGAIVLAECLTQWQDLPAAARARVLLVTLPLDDVEENAAMVNAIQRHAQVIVQMSLAEGFGLTVAEGMWKRRRSIRAMPSRMGKAGQEQHSRALRRRPPPAAMGTAHQRDHERLGQHGPATRSW
jgi:trehalose synthase